jgi:translocation and assembly module TamB
MSAQSRIGDYDISLQASGNSKHPNFKLTSVPPLSEQEIITLLAFGVTSSQLDERVHSKEQQNQSGFEIGAAIFSNNPLNKKIKDTFGLDLQLTSSFDSIRNISVPKFTASRRLNEKLNASASRSIGGEISTMEFELRYLLNQNVSAVGTYKSTETENPTLFTDSAKQNQSIFGVDLEFKRDFR